MALEEKKTIRHEGKEIEVACESTRESSSDPQSFLFTAQIGNTVYRHSHTIGPVDGPLPELPTKEQLQKDLDASRQYAARHAHFRDHIEATMKEID